MAAQENKAPKVLERVFVSGGLQGQDNSIDLLGWYFAKMRETTVETAHMDDFLTFALCASFFGVIMLEEKRVAQPSCNPNINNDSYSDHGEDFEEDHDGDTVLSGQENTKGPVGPPTVADPFGDAFVDVNTLSSEEKVDVWRRALTKDLKHAVENPPQGDSRNVFEFESSDGGKFATAFSPPVSPMFAHPRSPDFPQFAFSQEDTGGPSHSGTGMAMDVDHTTPAPASALVPEDEYINWAAAPEDQLREPAGKERAPDEAVGVASIAFDNHLSNYREVQAMEEDDVFGREGFIDDAGPLRDVPDLPPPDQDSPSVQEAAAQIALFQEQMRMKRIAAYQKNLRIERRRRDAREAAAAREPVITQRPIGLVYLCTSQTPGDLLQMGEYNLGMYVEKAFRYKHMVCPAIQQVVDFAFSNQDCHRIQSIIVDNPDKLYLLEALAESGFSNEGVRRRGFFSNIFKEWRDVSYCAMLATEWVMDATNPQGPRHARHRAESLWDEVFMRHQQECDDLIRLEERSSRLKRISSTETIKDHKPPAADTAPSVVDDSASNNAPTASDHPTDSESVASADTRAKRSMIDERRSAIVRYVTSARSSVSGRSEASLADDDETRWNFSAPNDEAGGHAPLSVASTPGVRPSSSISWASTGSVSLESVPSSSASSASFSSASSSQWVDLDREEE